MKEIIRKFLASQPKHYATGVSIYEKIGTNDFYKKLFSVGESDSSRRTLINELTKIYDSLEEESAIKPSSNSNIQYTGASGLIQMDIAKLSPRLRSLNEIRLAMFKQRAHLHAQMMALEEKPKFNSKRKQHLERIDELALYGDWIYRELDHFAINGHELPISDQLSTEKAMQIQLGQHKKARFVEIEDLSEIQLHRKLMVLRVERSKLKAKDRKNQNSANQAKIDTINEQIEAINSKLVK